MTMPRAAKKLATPLYELTATEIVAAIAAGKTTCEAMARQFKRMLAEMQTFFIFCARS